MSLAPKVNLRTRLSKLIDRSPASTNDQCNNNLDKCPVNDDNNSTPAFEASSPQQQYEDDNDLLERKKSTADRAQQQRQSSPSILPQQQQGQQHHKSFFPSMRLRTFSQDRPNHQNHNDYNTTNSTARGTFISSSSSYSNNHTTHKTTTAAVQSAEKPSSSSSLLLSQRSSNPPLVLPTTGDLYTKIKTDTATSLPNFISPEPRASVVVGSHGVGIVPVRHTLWNDPADYGDNQQQFHLPSPAAGTTSTLPLSSATSPSKFEIFLQKAEFKLAQREEMIVDLTNQTTKQEEEIQALQQDIVRLQKQLIQEQETVLHDGGTNTYITSLDTTTTTTTTTGTCAPKHQEQQQQQQQKALPGEVEDTSIANLLHKAFHDFQVLVEERNDFVPLDATYVRRLCYQVYEFTITKKRMEKQLFFVKGMCDQIVESLRDHLSSIEQKQTQVEHSRLNELSTKSYEQGLERQQLSDRLSIVLEEIKKYANELEQESYTNKALRDALIMVETDRANYERSMLNELSNLHEEKEEMSAEYAHQLLVKNALATQMQETLERTRFNYRASGLFGQSSKEDDPNAIVLLQDTPLQGGHQYVSTNSAGTLAKDTMGAAGSTTVLWGLPRSSVAQAFRHPPTQHNTLENLPSNANNNDKDYYYCNNNNQCNSTDESIDDNSDLQHRQTYSITPPSRKDKMLNRTYHQTKMALNALYLLESLVVGSNGPTVTKESVQKLQFANDVASNVNEIMIKRMIRKLERITNHNGTSMEMESNCHFNKSAFIVTARDVILSMLTIPEQDEEYKFMIETILIVNVFSIE